MKRKTKFNLFATIILAVFLASWFLVQRLAVGAVQQNLLLSVFNLAAHGAGMWLALRLLATWFRK